MKKTCRWHVFSEESPRAGPRAGGESAGLPGKRARKKIHNPKIFLSWRAKPNPSGRAKKNRTTLTGPSCYFFIQRGIRTEDPSVKKTCRWHVFSEESPRAGPRAGGESAGLPGKRARKKIHNPKIFLSWRAKPNPSGRAKNNRTTLTGPSCYFFIQRGIRTEDPSVKKTCRWHVFSEESPRAGPRAGGESAGLPGKRARKKIHNPKIFLSWRAKPNPSGRAKEAGVAFWQPLLLV